MYASLCECCIVDLCQFSQYTIDVRLEQYAAMKFCIRLNKSSAKTVTLLHQAYQDECLGRSTIAFVEERDSTAQIPHCGRLATATSPINVNTMSIVIEEDSHLSMRKIAGLLNITQPFVNQILRHLQMQRVLSTWVPHFLTSEQMDTRLHLCEEVLEWVAEDPHYLDWVIAVDESWVHHHGLLSQL